MLMDMLAVCRRIDGEEAKMIPWENAESKSRRSNKKACAMLISCFQV